MRSAPQPRPGTPATTPLNILNAAVATAPLTMSSREIAELTGKEHDNVRRDIKNMADALSLSFEEKSEPSTGGRPNKVFLLPKRETLILISGYNVELRARIIDRWQQLEDATRSRAEPTATMAAPKEAGVMFRMFKSIARQIGLDVNQAALAAARGTRRLTGVDPLAAMDVTHLLAPQQEDLLTPSDIAIRMGLSSGIAANKRLAAVGLQASHRDAKGRQHWEPTDAGKPFAVWLDTAKSNTDGTPIRQLKWTASIVDHLRNLNGEG